MARLRVGVPTKRGSIPDGGKKITSYNPPSWLWGQTGVLFIGYGRAVQGKVAGDVKLTIYGSEASLPISLFLFSCVSITIRKDRSLISENGI